MRGGDQRAEVWFDVSTSKSVSTVHVHEYTLIFVFFLAFLKHFKLCTDFASVARGDGSVSTDMPEAQLLIPAVPQVMTSSRCHASLKSFACFLFFQCLQEWCINIHLFRLFIYFHCAWVEDKPWRGFFLSYFRKFLLLVCRTSNVWEIVYFLTLVFSLFFCRCFAYFPYFQVIKSLVCLWSLESSCFPRASRKKTWFAKSRCGTIYILTYISLQRALWLIQLQSVQVPVLPPSQTSTLCHLPTASWSNPYSAMLPSL